MSETRSRSTADVRRGTVIRKAVEVFAATGYHATPVTAVADAAGISQAYVFRLFKDKLGEGAAKASGGTPDEVLAAMGDAYAGLIRDRSLLMMQVHAQSACDVPEIRAALASGTERIWRYARSRSRGDVAAVQSFLAYGHLCHLLVSAGLSDVDETWAVELTEGMTH